MKANPSLPLLRCGLASLLVSATAATAKAAPDVNVIPVTGYEYLSGGTPNPVYPDTSGVRLTDGELGSVASWYNNAFVLWTNASPEISFTFAGEETVTAFSIHLLSEPGAGIVVPEEIRVTSNSNPSISYTFTLDRGDFTTAEARWVSFDLPEPMTATGVTLWTSPATGAGTDWMGISEVQFQSIPEPGATALLVAGGTAALLAMRRKKAFR